MLNRESTRSFGVVSVAGLLVALLALPGIALGVDEDPKGTEGAEAKAAAAAEAPQMQADPYAAPERSSFGSFRMYGDVMFNLQTVDQNGNSSRFRKDFGFQDGVYLGSSKLTFVPDGDEPVGWFDTLELYGDGLGLDSNKKNRYRQWGLSAKKTDKYRFSVRSRSHNYFWTWDGYPGEFDLDRNFTDVDLSVNATSNLVFTANYRRWSTSGDQLSRFNYNRQSSDFPTAVDQSGNNFGLGVRWRVGQTTIFLNQDFRDFKSDYDLRDTANGSIASIAQSELREMKAPVTSGGFRTNLADRKVRIEADFLYSKQSLDSVYGRTWEGAPSGSDDTASRGEAERTLKHGNARVLWRPSTKWAFTAQYRRRGWDQGGFRSLVDDGRDNEAGFDYDIQLDQFAIGAEYAPLRALSVFGEYGTGKRKQSLALTGDTSDFDDTEQSAYKFGTRIRAGRVFDIEASYERNDIDNPFTRVAAADVDGYKVKARYRPNFRWVISGIYSATESESDPLLATDGTTSEASSQFRNLGVNISYMGGPGRTIYAGFSYLNNEINTPIIIWNPVPRFEVDGAALYDGKNTVWTLGGEYLLSQAVPVSLYGSLNYVDSDTTEIRSPELIWQPVDFPVEYYDARFGLRYVLPMGLILDAQGRWMEYTDTSELFAANSYDATMFVFGLGYRF
jgi:hypothetical protein